MVDVERIAGIEHQRCPYDLGQRTSVEFAVMPPFGEVQDDVSLFTRFVDVANVVEGGEKGPCVVHRFWVVDADLARPAGGSRQPR